MRRGGTTSAALGAVDGRSASGLSQVGRTRGGGRFCEAARVCRAPAQLPGVRIEPLPAISRGSRTKLAECVGGLIGTPLSIDRVQFEWVPPGPLLGELVGERPMDDEPATAVDVVLWSRLPDGQRAAVLLEVKLTEDGFTNCNGRTSRGNRRKDVCDSARLFFDDPAACYLRRPQGKQRDRRYWEIFATSHGSVCDAFPGAPSEGRCPFAFHAQQPMRNLAIARGMEQDENSVVSRAWFALCPHDENAEIAEHWNDWRALLPDPAMAQDFVRCLCVLSISFAWLIRFSAQWQDCAVQYMSLFPPTCTPTLAIVTRLCLSRSSYPVL